MPIRAEDPIIIYRVALCARPHGPTERGSSPRRRPLEEGTVLATALDDCVHDARHFGGDCGQRFSFQIGVVAIFGDVALILVAKIVFLLPDSNLPCHPERPAQTRIAELGELCLAAKG